MNCALYYRFFARILMKPNENNRIFFLLARLRVRESPNTIKTCLSAGTIDYDKIWKLWKPFFLVLTIDKLPVHSNQNALYVPTNKKNWSSNWIPGFENRFSLSRNRFLKRIPRSDHRVLDSTNRSLKSDAGFENRFVIWFRIPWFSGTPVPAIIGYLVPIFISSWQP